MKNQYAGPDSHRVIDECAICGEKVLGSDACNYDGDVCHRQCALDDLDSIGMDDWAR